MEKYGISVNTRYIWRLHVLMLYMELSPTQWGSSQLPLGDCTRTKGISVFEIFFNRFLSFLPLHSHSHTKESFLSVLNHLDVYLI